MINCLLLASTGPLPAASLGRHASLHYSSCITQVASLKLHYSSCITQVALLKLQYQVAILKLHYSSCNTKLHYSSCITQVAILSCITQVAYSRDLNCITSNLIGVSTQVKHSSGVSTQVKHSSQETPASRKLASHTFHRFHAVESIPSKPRPKPRPG